ncbi:MAG: hypothetical protein AAGH89_14260 [Verrucomicrobiota bacterium]
MKRAWWKFALGILLTFGAGTAFGVIGTIVVAQGAKKKMEDPKVGHALVPKHLDRKLNLTETQHDEVAEILESMIEEIVPIRNSTRKQLAGVVHTHGPKIREILEPEQEENYDQFLEKLARDWNVVLNVEPRPEQPAPEE